MKKLQLILLTVFLTVVSLRADTSYLLVQGPFGTAGAVETFKWEVSYQAGSLTTGQSLLNAIFGLATNSGQTYTDGFGGTSPLYTSGNSTQGASYSSSSFGLFVLSFTLQSTTVLQDPSYSPGWNYYVAGGSGASGSDGNGASYSNGAWTNSNDGAGTRTLVNGSFDGFVFGDTSFTSPATIAGTGNTPTPANFASATPVSAPEPTSLVLLLGIASGAALLRRR